MEKLNELSESSGRNIIYVVKGIFECNGKEKTFYYNKSLDNWSEYLVNPDPTQLGNATQFKNIPKDETLEAASDTANNRKRCAVRFEDPNYELVDIIILELKKSRYGFSKVSQRSLHDGKRESLSESSLKETKFSRETIMILKALNALGGKAKPSAIYEKAFGLPRFGREAALDFKQLRSEGLIDYNKNTIQYELTNKGINFLSLNRKENTMKNKKFKFIIEDNTGDYEWDNYPLVRDFDGTWEELEDYLKTTFDSEDRERLLNGDYILFDDDGEDGHIYIKETVNLSKENKLFENSDNLFDYVLNESSSLKESECSLEWLLDKAYVSEYRMVGKNSAEVRVRHTPELLTSDSMAARFEDDIPDGYRLEVDFLGEDPILGRNFDIYEVQLLKD